MSLKQWTPLAIARKAAEFLAEPGSKVLDIGSGIGKFCLTGAFFNPEATFLESSSGMSFTLCKSC